MSEREEYTPTTDEVRETYERARYYLDDMPEEGDSYRAGGGEFDRWITAHDRALREQIARLIDPRPWNPETAWWIFATHQQTHEELVAEAQEQTRVAARRVIDGLHLDIISSHHSLDGLRHRYDLSGHFREDL